MDLKLGVWKVMRRLKLDEAISGNTHRNSFLRKLIPRSRAYKNEQFDFRLDDDLSILINRADYTQWRIFSGNLSINEQIFQHLKVPADRFIMLDVGANIGGFTVLLSREIKTRQFEVHLFEPNPRIAGTLQENIRRLEVKDPSVKAIVSRLALGEREAVMPLRVDDEHSGLATLSVPDTFAHTIDVRVLRMDDYVREAGIEDLHFIKLDVEAFEPAVLAGAGQTLTRCRPILYMEYGNDWFVNFSVEQVSSVLNFLKNLGYRFLREAQNGDFIDLPMTVPALQEYRHLNILIVPTGS